MRNRLNGLLFIGAVGISLCGMRRAEAQTVSFSGYDWEVRSDEGGPGPNHWSASNVSVDSTGALHLKIIKDSSGTWSCSEVTMKQSLGFGKYQFQVIGRVDNLDKNIVLGLFNYPPPSIGPDGTNEIDIEMAHWGNVRYPIGNFTVWPAKSGVKEQSQTFDFKLNGDYTTHRFTWNSKSILFQCLNGHRDDNKNEFGHWLFHPTNYKEAIPQQAIPVHINLWLFKGHAPSDGKEVEIIISNFKFTPE